ncbi:MAG TPA: ATP-binding cassette domain-containing protein [Acetobacteraceae bacterium]|nr:ATP-binding cassette domain-containing protein [Acetobacteraceae bacterium]
MMLRLHVESKSFRTATGDTLPVLGRIDLALGRREIVALVGPSGCGKTTLLRIAGVLDTDYQGSIEWASGAMPRIGTVFQEPRLLPWRTVLENLLLAQRVRDRSLAARLLDTLDLTAFQDAYPATLSLGMARRVAIARAFVIEPELILLDEPFVSLDPASADRSRELLLTAWRTRPTAALLVTHDREEAAALSDRILLLGSRPTQVLEELIVPISARRQIS